MRSLWWQKGFGFAGMKPKTPETKAKHFWLNESQSEWKCVQCILKYAHEKEQQLETADIQAALAAIALAPFLWEEFFMSSFLPFLKIETRFEQLWLHEQQNHPKAVS